MPERNDVADVFEAELRSALFAPAENEFLGRLRRRVSAAEPARRSARRGVSRRLAFVLSVASAVLAIVLIAGPDRVSAFMQSVLGYIPGMGFVESEGTLRTIAAPLAVTRDGITLTVEQAVFDSKRSILVYSVEGIPWEARAASEDSAECLGLPTLQPEGGAALEAAGADMRGWGSGYRTRLTYGAVSAAADRVTLRVPCLTGARPGAAPEDWELTFELVPASAATVLVPVLLPTVSPDPAMSSAPGLLEGVRLQAESILALEEGYRVEGAVYFDPALTFAYQPIDPDFRMTDSAGSKIPFGSVMPEAPSESGAGRQAWALEIPAGTYANPLTLEMTSVVLEEAAGTEFIIDLGEPTGPARRSSGHPAGRGSDPCRRGFSKPVRHPAGRNRPPGSAGRRLGEHRTRRFARRVLRVRRPPPV
jgi:hypothetical protein